MSAQPAPPDIVPQTRIHELLQAYPELEAVLIEAAPVFAKLKNPVLRRTVARVATIAQAAVMAGMAPSELTDRLRRAAGLEPLPRGSEAAPIAEAGIAPPDWTAGPIALSLDADRVVEEGNHPLTRLRAAMAAGTPGRVFEIRSSFPPVPLVEVLRREGRDTWTGPDPRGGFRTLVRS